MDKQENTFFEDYKALMSEGDKLAKTAANPFFKSKYCPLPDVLEIVKPLAMRHNFIIVQYTLGLVLCTELRHVSGEIIQSTIPLPCKDHDDAQKVGGAITYMRRYELTCIMGLGESDDDGNTATKKPEPKPVSKVPSGKATILTEVEIRDAINTIESEQRELKTGYIPPRVPSAQKDGVTPDDIEPEGLRDEPIPWQPEPEATVKTSVKTSVPAQWTEIKNQRERAMMTTETAIAHIQSQYGKLRYPELSYAEANEMIVYLESVAREIAANNTPKTLQALNDSNPL